MSTQTKIVAFANQKGGVGKTTTMTHLGHYVRELPGRVILVDLDPQGNATSIFTDKIEEGGLVTSDLFTRDHGGTLLEVDERLALIPADDDLADALRLDYSYAEVFRERLKKIARDWQADMIIIDTPPTLGLGVVAALVAAEFVVAPIEPAHFAVSGVNKLIKTIKDIEASHNPDLKLIGFLINNFNRRSANQKQHVAELQEALGDLVAPHAIGHHAAVTDASETTRPVWFRPNGAAARKAATDMRGAMAWLCDAMGVKHV